MQDARATTHQKRTTRIGGGENGQRGDAAVSGRLVKCDVADAHITAHDDGQGADERPRSNGWWRYMYICVYMYTCMYVNMYVHTYMCVCLCV